MVAPVYISLSHLSYQFASGLTLWNNLNASFSEPLQALVGINGIGKSTLGRLLAGELTPSSGQVFASGRVYYLPQRYPGHDDDPLFKVLGTEHFYRAQTRIENGLMQEPDYDVLEHHWDWFTRLKQTSDSLNITFQWDLNDTWQQFSGGQQSQLLRLAALFQQPDFLILDEPSNHLDRQQKQNLLEWLLADNGVAKLVITHDRFLLTHIDVFYELSGNGLFRHTGGLEHYLDGRARRLQNQQLRLEQMDRQLKKQQRALQSAVEKNQRRAASGKHRAERQDASKLEVDFNIESGTKGRSSQLHRHQQALADTQVQRQQRYSEREWRDDIRIELPDSHLPPGKKVIELNNLVCGYAGFQTRPITLELAGPVHLQIQGDNGCGKSTLLHTLRGHLTALSGSITCHVQMAYLDQQLSVLQPEQSSWDNFMRIHPRASPETTGAALAAVGLKAAKHDVEVNLLSGSEQLRAAIAAVLMGPETPQLLLLDEPSNHLDLETAETLISAINAFAGALIIISHDDHLLANIRVDQVVHMSL
ncbi:ATP-binding cassette domain-containing protein [Gynuella sunshinyii]|uniref:ATPase component of ABC transporter with duplicated ATPase domain n=1 Tax=Gynuella sunshinyii YC6258 TaxID=1445510 RepID=A0A0C5VSQ1_9GAMM|nr:ATP-binding cassette domain-containing protein [Gynuella sunshinyii]AJQ93319.1 ATPase component of ABC transporter with duplicated ATPase domain [Gynuella sunshinyii YC6258]